MFFSEKSNGTFLNVNCLKQLFLVNLSNCLKKLFILMLILEEWFTTVGVWCIWKLWYHDVNGEGCFLYMHYNQVGAALSNLIQYVLFCCHCRAETFWWLVQHITKPFFQLCKFQQTISQLFHLPLLVGLSSTTKLLKVLQHY